MLIVFIALIGANDTYAALEHTNVTNTSEIPQIIGNITNSTDITDSSNNTANIRKTSKNETTPEEVQNITDSSNQTVNIQNSVADEKSQQTQKNKVTCSKMNIQNSTELKNNGSCANQQTTNITVTNSSKNTDTIQHLAAGDETNVKYNYVNNITIKQIKNAAASVKSFIETNHRLPNYITIGTSQVVMSDFLKLLISGLLETNNGKTTPITFKTVTMPSKPSETVKSGTITKAGYLSLAKRVNAFINTNGVLPNYATSTLGKLNYESLIYMFSKIINFDSTNGRLPTYVSVKPWSTVGTASTTSSSSSTSTPVPASLQQYLKATANCQVNNAQIQSLAKSLTSTKTSTLSKATTIFNWVRDNLGYSFYYNTKHGAVGTLNAMTGNCVDTSHLVVALERAAGIPARYEHVYAKFSSGTWYGHVIAQVYVNGKWYNADAISYSNSFGVVKNWNTATAKIYGIYASLPF